MKNGHKRDYQFKSKVMTETPELLKLENQINRAIYKRSNIIDYKTKEIIMTYDEVCNAFNILRCNDEYIEAYKINNSHYKRSNRLRERIASYLKMGNCLFLTLTFNETTLSNTNAETRKKYVKRYLKSVSDYYVANIDFGSKNDREHYHAVVLGDKVNYSLWHHLGAIKGEHIRCDKLSGVKLGKYISKLTNHAIKETTKRNAIIYSSVNKSKRNYDN